MTNTMILERVLRRYPIPVLRRVLACGGCGDCGSCWNFRQAVCAQYKDEIAANINQVIRDVAKSKGITVIGGQLVQ